MRTVAIVLCLATLGVRTARAEDTQANTEAKPAASAPAASSSNDAEEVPFPKAFRYWTHVKSMVIFSKKNPLFDAFGGIHHIYANKKALIALRSGKHEYPDGAAFVFDLLDSKPTAGAYVEGKRKFVATIYRDSKKYPDTEGWGWQAWENGDASKPVLKHLDDQKVCATCHRNEAANKGFVFTEWRR